MKHGSNSCGGARLACRSNERGGFLVRPVCGADLGLGLARLAFWSIPAECTYPDGFMKHGPAIIMGQDLLLAAPIRDGSFYGGETECVLLGNH